MFKTLLKKQLLEINKWLFFDKKNGKKRSSSGVAVLIIAYIILFGVLGGIFYAMADMLCEPMISIDAGWLYYAITGLVAIVLGVFGSVFNTFATLYKAKDNELLLSMPVTPGAILFARLFGTWFWSIIYEAIVFIPAIIAYCIYSPSSVAVNIICGIVLMLLLSVFVLSLSCILGWVVAKISNKLKNKTVVTVILSLAFIAIYYYFYAKAYELIQTVLDNILQIRDKIKGSVYPLYAMGRTGEGDILSMLVFALMIFALFGVIYLVMSKSFFKMALASGSAPKCRSGKISGKSRSVSSTLFVKELRRFSSSSIYILNCGLGCILMPILGVLALIKSDFVRSTIEKIGIHDDFTCLIVCGALCMLAAFNDITAPSVSLEGKNIWILQSLPVDPWKVLFAKLKMHFVLTEIPFLICSVCIIIAFEPAPVYAAMMILIPTLFVILSAAFGLTLNLKMPNLKWTDEVAPVKQSLGVILSMFGGWVYVILLGGLFYLLASYIPTTVFLGLTAVLTAVLGAVLILWIKKKGTKIFASL